MRNMIAASSTWDTWTNPETYPVDRVHKAAFTDAQASTMPRAVLSIKARYRHGMQFGEIAVKIYDVQSGGADVDADMADMRTNVGKLVDDLWTLSRAATGGNLYITELEVADDVQLAPVPRKAKYRLMTATIVAQFGLEPP